MTINFIGKSAHGSLPELGINSGIIALKVLGEVYDLGFLKRIAKDYEDVNGKNLNQYYVSKNLGQTTYNVGLISYLNQEFEMKVNFRYPENVDAKKVISSL